MATPWNPTPPWNPASQIHAGFKIEAGDGFTAADQNKIIENIIWLYNNYDET